MKNISAYVNKKWQHAFDTLDKCGVVKCLKQLRFKWKNIKRDSLRKLSWSSGLVGVTLGEVFLPALLI